MSAWDTELYEARHNFVWRFGEGVVELLEPKPGERILDLGCGTGQLTNKISESRRSSDRPRCVAQHDRPSSSKLPEAFASFSKTPPRCIRERI